MARVGAVIPSRGYDAFPHEIEVAGRAGLRGAGVRAMSWVTRPLRALSMLRFRVLGLAIIEDIPTAQFREIERRLVAEGWVRTYEYTGFDAWIDYGEVLLRRGRARLSFEWDNWSEGRIEGRADTVEAIAREHGLTARRTPRWGDDAP